MTDCRHDGPLQIVINPGSGHQDGEDTQAQIARLLQQAGRAHTFFPIEDPALIADVAQRAVAAARACAGVVVAVGGDGTLSAVAHAVLGSGLAFGVVPQGTFNYFGRANGISQDTAEAVAALLDSRPRPVQVGRVNGVLFLVNASVGLYPKLLEQREVDKERYGRSRWVAMWSGLRTLISEPRRLRLRVESEQGERDLVTPTLFVGNNVLQLDQVGVEEASAVAGNRGRLAAIVVRPVGTWSMLWLALRGALGTLGAAENVDTFAFRRLRVDPVGHRRIKVATDGEVRILPTPLTFEVADDPLMLMLPAREDRAEVK
jgi:diacylglycerol kinase family enzyme